MSTLRFCEKIIPATIPKQESSLPPIAEIANLQQQTVSDLGEDEGLFIGYGFVKGSFPYRQQDGYSRNLQDTPVRTAVLENAFLRASFLPDFGGRLWSLFDKTAERELLYENPVIRPCNLGVRNAWLAGGAEWNCGVVGHHPYTCSPLFTARLALEDGTPVLRFYEYERIRGAVVQMDFFLPETSHLLYARMRIVNPNEHIVPMYWWSNIAVREQKGARVVTDSLEAYTNKGSVVGKVAAPMRDGVDITYPVNSQTAVDYFWKIPPEKRKYIAHLGTDGYGLVQTSTRRLQGRKLFVWGQQAGGDHWQEFLTKDGDAGRYVEIQAGLAHTQYECVPMPQKTAWEWLEAYGPMQADASNVHGDWDGARAEVSARLNALTLENTLEELLEKTHAMALSPAAELVSQGGGWAALELLRLKKQGKPAFCPHLDFGGTEEPQQDWVQLLESGKFPQHAPEDVPVSWVLQEEWTQMLQDAVNGTAADSWYAWMQLGVTRFAMKDFEAAEVALRRSVELSPSPWALFGLAQAALLKKDNEEAGRLAQRAALMRMEDASLVIGVLRLMDAAEQNMLILSIEEKLNDDIKKLGRVRLYLAFAYLRLGRLQESEEILCSGGGILVADIREGESSVTTLWYQLEEAKAAREGRTFNADTAVLPRFLDFRMG